MKVCFNISIGLQLQRRRVHSNAEQPQRRKMVKKGRGSPPLVAPRLSIRGVGASSRPPRGGFFQGQFCCAAQVSGPPCCPRRVAPQRLRQQEASGNNCSRGICSPSLLCQAGRCRGSPPPPPRPSRWLSFICSGRAGPLPWCCLTPLTGGL